MSESRSNIVTCEKLRERINKDKAVYGVDKATLRINWLIRPVINELAKAKPTWLFTADEAVRDASSADSIEYLAKCFTVSENGEELGTIKCGYRGSSNKIIIENPRINGKLERGRGYATEDTKRAVAKVKKEFYRLSAQERIEKAHAHAFSYISVASSNNSRHIANNEHKILEMATKYVMKEGFNSFLQYQRDHGDPSHYKTLCKMLETREELNAAMSVIETVRNAAKANETMLVVRDANMYITRRGATLNLYDDNTLPEAVRGKLGLLKLVEAEHIVANVGCRVSNDVFLVIMEDGDTTNNVNEGEA
jgi:hypothetical protein